MIFYLKIQVVTLIFASIANFMMPVHAHEVYIYCTTECNSGNSADPCGDGHGQQSSCAATDFVNVTMGNFGYTDASKLPLGFVGCSHSICVDACSSVENSTQAIEVVTDTNGKKTFCFPKRSTSDGMFMAKDAAEMSAISRGCSGAHQMGEMFMQGSTHSACMDSYVEAGVVFGNPDSSSPKLLLFSPILVPVLSMAFSVLFI